MALLDLLFLVRGKARMRRGVSFLPHFDLEENRLPSSEKHPLLVNAQSDLGRVIYAHQGRVVDKWTHYPDIYERHLHPFRGSAFKMLEIGVFKGGSLEIWRKYFGPSATIFGVDINPDCANYVSPPNHVRIGSQADPQFLRSVVQEMGGVDVILDDGSHIAGHQEASFRTLFPLLNNGGLYIIEDLHTAYWPGGYEGGYRRKGTAIELMKQMIDDMHGWYHRKRPKALHPSEILAIHVYDSIAVIEKGVKAAPQHIRVP